MQIYCISSKMILLFFKIESSKMIDWAYGQTTCRSTFSTPIETTPKHVQQDLLATKISDHSFFSWYVGIKTSHWVPSQGCMADDPTIGSHVEQWFVSLVSFSNFSEDFRQTNCSVQLRIDSPTMLNWNSHYMAKKQTEVIFPQTTFVGFGSASKNCCFLSGSYSQIHDSTAVTIL